MDKLKELLIRSFDEELPVEEKAMLEEALQQSGELRAEKEEMKKMRDTLTGFSPSFSNNFSKSVLENVEEKVQSDESLYSLFKRFALGAVAAIVLLLVSVYFTDGSISADSVLGLSELTSDNLLLALSTF